MQTNPHARRILCYGDSNTRGRTPGKMGTQRLPIDQRRPGALQDLLGNDFEVIEEGLGGRTTMFDDPRPEFPERNGLKTLPIILEAHLPLDLVVIILGTTDAKQIMQITSKDSAEGIRQIIHTIKTYKILEGHKAPQILIIVPAIVDENAPFASTLFQGASSKTREIISLYKQVADETQVHYLDPTNDIQVNAAEGVHIDADNHKILAQLVYEKIKKM